MKALAPAHYPSLFDDVLVSLDHLSALFPREDGDGFGELGQRARSAV